MGLLLKHQPVGQLAEIIEEFILFKRSQGFKYIIEENTLYRFSVFSTKYSFTGKVIPEIMLSDWFKLKPGEKVRTQHHRNSCTTIFLRYAIDYGYKVVLPEIPKSRIKKYVPYIFTNDEIKAFFTACDNFKPYAGSHRHEIIPVLFRLLYGCGLRSSEAANLKIKDVDLCNGVLTIQEPKNRKDRYVPMSPSLINAMRWFHNCLHSDELSDDCFFFKGKYNDYIDRHKIYHWFRLCLDKAGIAHMGRGYGPREHDLRHSFCVHSLRNLSLAGIDIYYLLPILSVYIGHKSIAETQYYLRLTADMYPDICSRLEKELCKIIPSEEVPE